MKNWQVSTAAGLALAASALGQADFDTPPGLQIGAHPFIEHEARSGGMKNLTGELSAVWSTIVSIDGANWVRLRFSEGVLPETASGDAYLRITSLFDGAVQTLNQRTLGEWNSTSAYFNGESVLVELILPPGDAWAAVGIDGAWAGIPGANEPESICGTVDDRVLSNDPRAARYLPAGCTAWLINDFGKCFLSAGHCVSAPGVVEFNVPLSSCGSFSCIQHPPPEDQYSLDTSTQQTTPSVVLGNDWTYFGCFPNSVTGLTAGEAQGQFYNLPASVPSPTGSENIRITGYGSTSAPVNPQWYLVQKTHVGPYTAENGTILQYRTDTTGGNSGSPILWEEQNLALGIHTNAGCSSTGGANQGTSVDQVALRNALANARGFCGGPPPEPEPPIFIASASNSNIGTLSRDDGGFVSAKASGLQWDGMAYDANTRTFYLCTFNVSLGTLLYTLDEDTMTLTQLGAVSPSNVRLWGLAFDPNSNTLYGVNQSGGQLYRVNTTTRAATAIGGLGGGTIGAIDFDADTNTLYGLSDQSGGSRLLRIDTTTGVQTLVGLLGPGIVDCDGLAWASDDGMLYTVDDSLDRMYRINPGTGAATLIGTVNTSIGTGYGMAGGRAGCAADLSGASDPNDPAYGVPDGNADASDFFYFLDQFVGGNLAVADLTGSSDPNDPAYGNPDGSIDASDFFFFLDIFVQGCD